MPRPVAAHRRRSTTGRSAHGATRCGKDRRHSPGRPAAPARDQSRTAARTPQPFTYSCSGQGGSPHTTGRSDNLEAKSSIVHPPRHVRARHESPMRRQAETDETESLNRHPLCRVAGGSGNRIFGAPLGSSCGPGLDSGRHCSAPRRSWSGSRVPATLTESSEQFGPSPGAAAIRRCASQIALGRPSNWARCGSRCAVSRRHRSASIEGSCPDPLV